MAPRRVRLRQLRRHLLCTALSHTTSYAAAAAAGYGVGKCCSLAIYARALVANFPRRLARIDDTLIVRRQYARPGSEAHNKLGRGR